MSGGLGPPHGATPSVDPIQLVGPHVDFGLAPHEHLPPRKLDGGLRDLLGVELGAFQLGVFAVSFFFSNFQKILKRKVSPRARLPYIINLQ